MEQLGRKWAYLLNDSHFVTDFNFNEWIFEDIRRIDLTDFVEWEEKFTLVDLAFIFFSFFDVYKLQTEANQP